MNLVRNHVLYYQDQLHELCAKEGKARKACPREAFVKPPRPVSSKYMAPGSRAAKHYLWPKELRRRPARRKR